MNYSTVFYLIFSNLSSNDYSLCPFLSSILSAIYESVLTSDDFFGFVFCFSKITLSFANLSLEVMALALLPPLECSDESRA